MFPGKTIRGINGNRSGQGHCRRRIHG
jgi:hypothetical protein